MAKESGDSLGFPGLWGTANGELEVSEKAEFDVSRHMAVLGWEEQV